MNINDYFTGLNNASQDIFSQTISDFKNLGNSHHLASFIAEFSENIDDINEKQLIMTVAIQLESATLNLLYGMYRQAYSSLRLALELGLGAIYFSAHKLDHHEWISGKNDIKWSKLINEDNGVLSVRFSKAFFPELEDTLPSYNENSKELYRELSEFVHGNYNTWTKSGLKIEYNNSLVLDYFKYFKSVTDILIFSLCCRYLKTMQQQKLETISLFLLEEFNHIAPIREYLGGVKEIKP